MLANAIHNALYPTRPLTWLEAFILAGATTLVALPPLYLTKSALGINLTPGPSPLHELFYWIVV